MNKIMCKYRFVLLLAICMALFFYACQDSKSREQIDETVETITGQDSANQLNKIKKEIEKIEKKQADRLKQFDE